MVLSNNNNVVEGYINDAISSNIGKKAFSYNWRTVFSDMEKPVYFGKYEKIT